MNLRGNEIDWKLSVFLIPAVREIFGIDSAKHPRSRAFDKRRIHNFLTTYFQFLGSDEIMSTIAQQKGSNWHPILDFLEDDCLLSYEQQILKQDAEAVTRENIKKFGTAYRCLEKAHGGGSCETIIDLKEDKEEKVDEISLITVSTESTLEEED